jgi:hypothetical protein
MLLQNVGILLYHYMVSQVAHDLNVGIVLVNYFQNVQILFVRFLFITLIFY